MASSEEKLATTTTVDYAHKLATLNTTILRKTDGAHYTPASLVECLLDSTLQPLIDEALTAPTPAGRINRLMAITVCDPSCGAGAFLIAAARRIADAVAAQWATWHTPARRGPLGQPQPTVEDRQRATRTVVSTLIHGVDLSESAAELAKVALWLEAFHPGLPNAYLDDKIRVGNALLGTTPALQTAGIPDAAYARLPGDDTPVVTALRRRNAAERDQPTEAVLF